MNYIIQLIMLNDFFLKLTPTKDKGKYERKSNKTKR